VAKVLSLNPFAVYIQLVRVAFMSSFRSSSAGNKPYSARLCQTFLSDPGGPGHAPLQAYCHAIVTNDDLWIAGAAWAVGFFVIGLVFFWQAESKYGRG
jgi:hypothetical protein